LTPLLAKVRWADDEQGTPSFRPILGEQYPRLDCLAESYFVGEDGPLGQGRPESEERGLNLVGIQIHLGIR